MASTTRACSKALRVSRRIAAPAATVSGRCFSAVVVKRFGPSHPTTVTQRRVAVPAPRFFSSGENTHTSRHEISATGSKLWNFEQMSELAKSPKGVVIVDAREPGELEQTGFIPSAINIPVVTAPESFHMSEQDFEDRYGFARPGKEEELVFYCKAGVRSRALAALAREAGWKNVGEYPGSWLDWEKNGGKVQTVRRKRSP
ncbi:Thiosulfate sulfurtransferase RDL2, mitochondrial [Colletotrichum sojae]|uniref:Thiosulfate sulfurtransferase RDL2, mitochondrial n=1 Tax=Colletotrichum sojae TaxID=2175907 RepID=A0A8H6JY40_9PEZI|nr:Thiosulfate sulfurtransferase RDL2, mitochondrial [Colletotrichum sojae]